MNTGISKTRYRQDLCRTKIALLQLKLRHRAQLIFSAICIAVSPISDFFKRGYVIGLK